jgi:alanine dehydrogenase
MARPKSIGLPRMRVEAGEKRVFLPEFVDQLTQLGLHVYLEEGYGSRLGYTFDAYRRGNDNIYRCTRDEAFSKDLVLILRAPKREEYHRLKPGSVLISMLHFPTRPARVKALQESGIKAISLDSIVDDYNLRRVEDMPAVAWNGLEVAFNELEKVWPGLEKPHNPLIKVLILGTGMVGKHAVEAATKLGNVERYTECLEKRTGYALAISVGRSVTGNPSLMKTLMQDTDILVDATQRRDPSRPVVPNDWIAWLPEHAIIVDLAVDPYLPDNEPPVVRGIEGIPMGNLNQYIFHPADENWSEKIPAGVSTQNRRTTVSSYSWPGIHPEASMTHYARQLLPFMEVLVEKGYDGLSPEGGFFERALYRGTIKAYLENNP